ncbi:unnamed protein product, partial [Adineta steineri]
MSFLSFNPCVGSVAALLLNGASLGNEATLFELVDRIDAIDSSEKEHRATTEELDYQKKNLKTEIERTEEIRRKEVAQENKHREMVAELQNEKRRLRKEMRRKQEAQENEHRARVAELDNQNKKLMEEIKRKEEVQEEKDRKADARYEKLHEQMEQ